MWREIVSACRALESPLTVAYLAPQATFTHQAARERFGESAAYHRLRGRSPTSSRTSSAAAPSIGVVPVENTTDGAVNVTLDRLVETELQICGELTLEIAQHLLSRARRPRRDQARAVAPPGARPVPRLAGREPARRAGRGDHVHRRRRRAGRHRRDGGRHRLRPGRPPLQRAGAARRASRTTDTTPRASWSSAASPRARAGS